MEATTTQVRLEKNLKASPEEVFDAWTDPEILARWMAPSPEYYPRVHVHDDGSFTIAMCHQGGAVHTVEGMYLEVHRPQRLVLEWGWADGPMGGEKSVVTVELDGTDEQTKLVLTHDFSGDGADAVAAEHQKGWIGCLRRLESVFARTPDHQISVILSLHRRLYESALRDISPEHLDRRLTENTNHMRWIAGHLAHTRALIAGLLGDTSLGESPLAAFNEPITDGATYPNLDDIRTFFQRATGAIHARLPHVTAELLDAPAPMPHPANDATVGGLVDFLVDHESYHIGQLGFIRKALGYGAMSYSVTQQAAPADL